MNIEPELANIKLGLAEHRIKWSKRLMVFGWFLASLGLFWVVFGSDPVRQILSALASIVVLAVVAWNRMAVKAWMKDREDILRRM